MKIRLDKKEVSEILKTYAMDTLLQPCGKRVDVFVVNDYSGYEIEIVEKEVESDGETGS